MHVHQDPVKHKSSRFIAHVSNFKHVQSMSGWQLYIGVDFSKR